MGSAEIDVSAGTIEYDDTGGDGPVVVLLHGVMMGASLWRNVVAELAPRYRCVVPMLPLGSHRLPLRADADRSSVGMARIVVEFLERLGLEDVTLVGNDTGGAFAQMVAVSAPERIGRLVLASCDAFDNYPPGLPGRVSRLAALLPGGLVMAAQTVRFAPLRRLPLTFGWMAKRPIPAEVFAEWLRPWRTRREIRHDVGAFLRTVRPGDTLAAAERLGDFGRPALIVWAAEDKVMPLAHGRRLAELLPDSRLVEIEDSYTMIPEDQPVEFARHIDEFVSAQIGAREERA